MPTSLPSLSRPAATATGNRRLTPGEISAAAARLEGASAAEVVGWAVEVFGADVPIACSFQDAVLLDVVAGVIARPRVLFVDTGAHFPETLDFAEQLRRRYDLDLRVVGAPLGPDAPACGSDGCCAVRKVAPLRRALAGAVGWMTGLRRADSPQRADTPVVGDDGVFGLAKVAPLAAWSDADVAARIAERGLPEHPLRAHGYTSIGCAPTTRPVAAGEDPRAGRWPGQAKTECGLHA